MITVHRIGHKSFIGDLEGIGARKYGGRWNPPGIPCIYCSEHLSLAMLETFVHAQGKGDKVNLAAISLKIPAAARLYKIEVAKMEHGWQDNIAYSQWLGRQVLEDYSYAGFIVPSIIIPAEVNIVLNPLATSFRKIIASAPQDFSIDSRLVGQL